MKNQMGSGWRGIFYHTRMFITASTPATEAIIFEKQVDSKELGSHSDQMTVEKSLPLAGLDPGKYKVTIKINDALSKQEIAQSAPFVVE